MSNLYSESAPGEIKAFHVRTVVGPGGRIEIFGADFVPGEVLDVFIVPATGSSPKISLVEFLKALPPGPRSAATWEEIERNLQEDRDSWDR